MSALLFLKNTSLNILELFESSLGRILPIFILAIVVYFVITYIINRNKNNKNE